MDPLKIVLIALGVLTAFYVVTLVVGIARKRAAEGGSAAPTPLGLATGLVTNFFDTLGIGSFAPTTSIFRATRMVPDEEIPGTLNVGHTLPTVTQAFLFITAVAVDFKTLMLMIAAAMVGSWFGAGIVANWPRRNIQIGMGIALLAAAAFFTLKNIDAMRATPVFPGGTALALSGGLLIAGIAGMLFLGALMTLGIGLYAPCMVLVALLGMDPKAAFPIMMGACAFLMPVASARFVKERKFNMKAALGLLIGGVPGVLFAYYIVKEMNLRVMLWLVVVVVTYTGFTMLRAAQRERLAGAGGAGAAKP